MTGYTSRDVGRLFNYGVHCFNKYKTMKFFFLVSVWNAVSFKRIDQFYLNFEMYWYKVIQKSFLIFSGLQNSINVHFSFLILIICAFTLSIDQYRQILSIYLVFVKNYLFSFIFSIIYILFYVINFSFCIYY